MGVRSVLALTVVRLWVWGHAAVDLEAQAEAHWRTLVQGDVPGLMATMDPEARVAFFGSPGRNFSPAKGSSRPSLGHKSHDACIRAAGVVGLGGGFPTHAKRKAARGVRHLLINAKESDPNAACDIRLLKERPREVVEGIEVLARALGNPEVNPSGRASGGSRRSFASVDIGWYTSGPAIPWEASGCLCGRFEVPLGRYPPDVGVLVHNVGTTYAADRLCAMGFLSSPPA